VIAAVGFLLAVALVSLSGYGIHWMMHQPWSGPFYHSHMEHHQVHYPAGDLYSAGEYRSSGLATGWLTFTPFVVLIGLGILAILSLALHLDLSVSATVVGVVAIVGWAHGYVHDAFHVSDHWLGRFAWFRNLRLIHEPHHIDMSKNLGILWFGWDRLFRTFKRPDEHETGDS